MALNFGFGEGDDSLFAHNRAFNEGVNQKGIRAGASTVLVALDGSGDAETIQEGLDLIGSGGGVVYLKEGTYRISETLVIQKNRTAIIGAGRSSIIKEVPGTLNGEALLRATSKNSIVLKNIYFNQDGTDIVGIEFNGATDSFIGFNWFANGSDSDILLTNSSNSNIVIQNRSTSWGLKINASEKNVIIGNTVTSSSRGIFILWGSNNIVSGNVCNDNTGEGILVQAADAAHQANENIIANNICQGNDYGVRIVNANASDNVVDGNVTSGNTTADYSDTGTDTVVFAGETFTAANHTAIANGAPHHAESHNAASHSDIASTGANIDAAVTASHAQSHTVASHSDTTATGAETDDLTDGTMVDDLHLHSRLSTASESDAWWLDSYGNLKCGVVTAAIKLPNLTTTQRNNLSSVQNGMIIYNTTVGGMQIYAGGWMDIEGA